MEHKYFIDIWVDVIVTDDAVVTYLHPRHELVHIIWM